MSPGESRPAERAGVSQGVCIAHQTQLSSHSGRLFTGVIVQRDPRPSIPMQSPPAADPPPAFPAPCQLLPAPNPLGEGWCWGTGGFCSGGSPPLHAHRWPGVCTCMNTHVRPSLTPAVRGVQIQGHPPGLPGHCHPLPTPSRRNPPTDSTKKERKQGNFQKIFHGGKRKAGGGVDRRGDLHVPPDVMTC